jgi:hypothetical protein
MPCPRTEALLYLWEITSPRTSQVFYRYVGKAKDGAGRSPSGYERNVRKLLADRPYRTRARWPSLVRYTL